MRNTSKLTGSRSSMQELIDENECLREKLAATEADYKFKQKLHKTLSGAINIGYWEWDETTNRADYFSEEFATILGMSLESLYELYRCEEDLYPLIHPDDLEHYIDNLGTLLNPDYPRGLAHIFDFRIVRPNGEVRYLRELEYGIREENGVITRSYGAIQDITDHQETTRALKDSKQHFSSVFSQLPIGILEQDWSSIKKSVDKLHSEGVADLKQYYKNNPLLLKELVDSIIITNVNNRMLEIYRANSLAEFKEDGEDVSSWWDDNWAELYASEIAALANPGKIHYGELTETRLDGTEFDVRLITRLGEGDEKTWNRILTIVEDVTKRKKYETDLIEAKTAAEKANRAKTDFLSNMSHELRTPLNAILGYSQLFEYDASLGEQRQSKARAINNAGKHLLNLIDEILDLSTIESGNIELSIEAVSLEKVIKDSVAWVAEMAESHEISIDFEPAVFSGVLIKADAIRLRQVFLNLLTNAVKYNREGGKVKIEFALDNQGLARISIADTGTGISPDRLGELFKPFSRLGAEFSAIEGTGIGLVITRRLVELMQGQLEVDSRLGEGSTFTVQFQSILTSQLDIDNSDNDSDDIEICGSIMTRPRILVAEDNPVNRQLINAQLDLLGYSADYAENGIEALKLWKIGNCQLLLTDIRMPEMDGYELIRQIRSLESAGEASPIIAVTANAMESDAKRCLDMGASDFISKPFTLEALKQILEKWSQQPEKPVTGVSSRAEIPEIAHQDAINISILRQSVGEMFKIQCELLISYVEALPGALSDIQRAFAADNYAQLADYAHKLKSSSGGLGAMQIADTCQMLELAGREGRTSDIESSVRRLTKYAEQVTRFVAEYCKSPPLQTAIKPVVDNTEEILKNDLRVLLVDDDYIMHRVTTLMLNDLGIANVLTALTGRQALEIIDENPNAIDVVICDLNMPEMDGVEFTRFLAKQNYNGSLILSSGEDIRILKTVEKLAIEHELYVLGILEKPVTLTKLRELLSTLEQIRTDGAIPISTEYSAEELARAIDGGEMDTYFQPKIDVLSRQVVGVEALVRWNHPTDGLIGPFDFIHLVEKNNLIYELTQAVCKKVLQYVSRWQAQGINLDIAINISTEALRNLDWPDEIASQVEAAGLQPSNVTFEITESHLMEHFVVALDILSRLSLKRFKLSIDDFGTGYSSMEQLQRVPFSELKIDRAFVRGASEDASARAILESSVSLAKKLDMKVVAEGVETEADWNLVAKLGCDEVQGFYIARPMPADQLCRWLATQKLKAG